MPDSPPLTAAQYDRYRRHLSLPEFGVEGQRRLLESSVLPGFHDLDPILSDPTRPLIFYALSLEGRQLRLTRACAGVRVDF